MDNRDFNYDEKIGEYMKTNAPKTFAALASLKKSSDWEVLHKAKTDVSAKDFCIFLIDHRGAEDFDDLADSLLYDPYEDLDDGDEDAKYQNWLGKLCDTMTLSEYQFGALVEEFTESATKEAKSTGATNTLATGEDKQAGTAGAKGDRKTKKGKKKKKKRKHRKYRKTLADGKQVERETDSSGEDDPERVYFNDEAEDAPTISVGDDAADGIDTLKKGVRDHAEAETQQEPRNQTADAQQHLEQGGTFSPMAGESPGDSEDMLKRTKQEKQKETKQLGVGDVAADPKQKLEPQSVDSTLEGSTTGDNQGVLKRAQQDTPKKVTQCKASGAPAAPKKKAHSETSKIEKAPSKDGSRKSKSKSNRRKGCCCSCFG